MKKKKMSTLMFDSVRGLEERMKVLLRNRYPHVEINNHSSVSVRLHLFVYGMLSSMEKELYSIEFVPSLHFSPEELSMLTKYARESSISKQDALIALLTKAIEIDENTRTILRLQQQKKLAPEDLKLTIVVKIKGQLEWQEDE